MSDDTPTVLNDAELQVVLQRLPGWRVADGQLTKEFRFKDFLDSLSFVNHLVPFFEAKDHHPDITIRYNRVMFALARHDIGGKITSLDGEVAQHIEHQYSARKD